MPLISQWKVFCALVAADISYFVLLLMSLYLLPKSPKEPTIFHFLPIIYFVVPAIFCLLGLVVTKQLSFRVFPLRSIALIAWALVLPGIIFFAAVFGTMEACHLDVIPNCQPY